MEKIPAKKLARFLQAQQVNMSPSQLKTHIQYRWQHEKKGLIAENVLYLTASLWSKYLLY